MILGRFPLVEPARCAGCDRPMAVGEPVYIWNAPDDCAGFCSLRCAELAYWGPT